MHITLNIKMKMAYKMTLPKDYFCHARAKNIFMAFAMILNPFKESYIFYLKSSNPCS